MTNEQLSRDPEEEKRDRILANADRILSEEPDEEEAERAEKSLEFRAGDKVVVEYLGGMDPEPWTIDSIDKAAGTASCSRDVATEEGSLRESEKRFATIPLSELAELMREHAPERVSEFQNRDKE